MKKSLYSAIFTIALASLTACSSDDTAAPADDNVAAQITAGISESVTRAVNATWSADDSIGVRVVSSTNNSQMATLYKNAKYVNKSGASTTATFAPADESQRMFFKDKTETVTFSAYAPYQSGTVSSLPGTGGKVSVNTKDNNGSTTDQEKIDFIYASGATASKNSPTVKFADDYAFRHKMARLKLTFKAGSGFNSSDILSTDANVKFSFSIGGLQHEGTFDVTTGEAVATGDKVDAWDITDCANVEDETEGSELITYTLILLPQDLSDAPLTLTATSNGQPYINSTLIKPNMEAGKSYSYTITVNQTELIISGCTITDWENGQSDTDDTSGDAGMPDAQ